MGIRLFIFQFYFLLPLYTYIVCVCSLSFLFAIICSIIIMSVCLFVCLCVCVCSRVFFSRVSLVFDCCTSFSAWMCLQVELTRQPSAVSFRSFARVRSWFRVIRPFLL